MGPHSDSDRHVNVGVAAHISAASSLGPRFDPSQTAEERSSAANGIWLCQTCAKLIDNDETRFSAKVLRDWRDEAERAVSESLGKTAANAEKGVAIVRNIYRRGMGWSVRDSKESGVMVAASYLVTNLTFHELIFARVEARFADLIEQVGLTFFPQNGRDATGRVAAGNTIEVGIGFFAPDPPAGESFVADLLFVDQLGIEHRLVGERFPRRREE